MAYCVHCGSKLEKGQKFCPICNIEIRDPLEEEDESVTEIYPKYVPITEDNVSRKSISILITLLFLIPAAITLICDLSITGKVTWSGYVLASLCLLYVPFVCFVLFSKLKDKLLYLCLGMLVVFISLTMFLQYISNKTGGKWFLPFALPLVLIVMAAFYACVAMRKLLGFPKLLLSAVILILTGVLSLITEILIISAFMPGQGLVWSLYPLSIFVLLGGVLLWINFNTNIKEKLRRKFFI